MPTWKHGDLVWVQVRGHPVWPGQVMDPKRAPDNARSRQKPGTTLVAFFGDSSFGWFGTDLILSFKKNLEAYAGQKDASHKSFTRAVEEAVEVMTRREGSVPTTNHDPPDFLQPSEDEEDIPDTDPRAAMVVKVPGPAKPTSEDLSTANAEESLQWLLGAAEDPAAVVDVDPGKLVLSLLITRCAEGKSKGKKKRMTKIKKEKKAVVKEKEEVETPEPEPEPVPEPPEVEVDDVRDEDFVLDGALAVLREGARRASHPVRKTRRRSKVTRAGDKEEVEPEEPPKEPEEKPPEPELGEDGLPKKKTPVRKGPARRRKGLFLRDDQGFIHLKMTMEEGLATLARLAVDPWDWLPEEETEAPHPLRVMLLRYREKVYERSHLALTTASQKDDVAVGDLLAEALKTAVPAAVSKAEVDEKEAKAREKAREKAAEKAAERAAKPKGPGRRRPLGLDPIVPDSEMTGPVKIFRTLIEHVPPTEEAFRADIQALYDRLGGTLPQTVNYEKGVINLHGLLKGVAAFGGYQWVCYKKHWKAIALELRPELRDHTHTHTGHNLKERYYKFLLRYEEELNKDLPYEQKERKKRRRRNTSGQGRGRKKQEGEEGGMKGMLDSEEDDDDDVNAMGEISVTKMKKRQKLEMNGALGGGQFPVQFSSGIPKYAAQQQNPLLLQLEGMLNPANMGTMPMRTAGKTPDEIARMHQKRAEDAERQRLREAEPRTGLTAVKITFEDGSILPATSLVRHNASKFGEVSVESAGNYSIMLVYQYEYDARIALEAYSAPSKHGGTAAKSLFNLGKDPDMQLVPAPLPGPGVVRPWMPRSGMAAGARPSWPGPASRPASMGTLVPGGMNPTDPRRMQQQGPVAVPAPVVNHMNQAAMMDPRRGSQGVPQLQNYMVQGQNPMGMSGMDPRSQRGPQGNVQGMQQNAGMAGMQHMQPAYMLHPQNYGINFGLQGALGMHMPQMQMHQPQQQQQQQQHMQAQTSAAIAANDNLNVPLNLDASDLAALMQSISNMPQQDMMQHNMAQMNPAAAPVAPTTDGGQDMNQADISSKMLSLLGRLGDGTQGEGHV